MVKVLRIISKDGIAEHWAINDLGMNDPGRLKLGKASWKIEEHPPRLEAGHQCGGLPMPKGSGTAFSYRIGAQGLLGF